MKHSTQERQKKDTGRVSPSISGREELMIRFVLNSDRACNSWPISDMQSDHKIFCGMACPKSENAVIVCSWSFVLIWSEGFKGFLPKLKHLMVKQSQTFPVPYFYKSLRGIMWIVKQIVVLSLNFTMKMAFEDEMIFTLRFSERNSAGTLLMWNKPGAVLKGLSSSVLSSSWDTLQFGFGHPRSTGKTGNSKGAYVLKVLLDLSMLPSGRPCKSFHRCLY